MAVSNGEWKSTHGRAPSTIARSFSAAMNEAFKMDSNLESLSQSVAQKQEAISSQKTELEHLEARLRETEARLRERQSRSSTPTGSLNSHPSPRTGSLNSHPSPRPQHQQQRQRPTLDGVFEPPPTPPKTADAQLQQHNSPGKTGGWSLLPSPSPTREFHYQYTPPFMTNRSARNLVHSGFEPGEVDRRKGLSVGNASILRRKKSGALDI